MKSFSLAFIGIFVALDVIGTLPFYASMTHAMSRPKRDEVLNQSMMTAFVVAVAFAFMGKQVFRVLGISVPDFRVAGGIILLLVSLADLLGDPEVRRRSTGSTGVVPLAVPLITGPAVLTTLILQIAQFGYPTTLAALLVNYLLGWFVMRHSHVVTRVIGKDGTVVVSKLAALLLAAIAVSMIRTGVFEAIAVLRH